MFARALPAPSEASFLLLGPRGTGKTTWLTQHFGDCVTYDLLRAAESLRLCRDPEAFTAECSALSRGAWVVVDEIQKAPLLLDEVQHLMTKRGLRFAMSGSSARKLRRGGSNLLAGRAEIRRLFPFVSAELGFDRSLEDATEHGMLPLAVESARPRGFLRAYVETYLREEIQAEAIVRQIGGFSRFLEVAARMNGQTVNVAGVARDAGVARQTVQGYFQILDDTLIGWWLPAWKRKRSVKQVAHSKFYLFDCGVARHLAGLGHLPVHLEERGFLFETYLLHEVRAYLHYEDLEYPVFYWRTQHGLEVDLVVEMAHGLLAVEMKSARRWDRRFHAGLKRFRELHEKPPVESLGVFQGPRELLVDGVRVLPWRKFLKLLWAGEIIPR